MRPDNHTIFSNFAAKYAPDNVTSGLADIPTELNSRCNGIGELMSLYSGVSFNGGIYRVHKASDILYWTARVVEMFPAFSKRVYCFAYDWMGSQFAVDMKSTPDEEPGILSFEAYSGEVLRIPRTLLGFHNEELVVSAEKVVLEKLFQQWIGAGGARPEYSECIGYKVPGFLGGEYSFENLECISMSVYWGVHAQLWTLLQYVPPGTTIRSVGIADP